MTGDGSGRPGTGLTVSPDTLAAHATQADGVAYRVDNAKSAASTVGVGDPGMYGALCAGILVPAVQKLFGENVDLIAGAAELGRALASGVRSNETGYREVEDRITALIEGIT